MVIRAGQCSGECVRGLGRSVEGRADREMAGLGPELLAIRAGSGSLETHYLGLVVPRPEIESLRMAARLNLWTTIIVVGHRITLSFI